MVLKKRLDYGFNGHQIPIVPRAPRSVRRRRPTKQTMGDHQICAFELLAAVAGQLLQENESSSTSSNAYGAKDLFGIHTECVKEERIEHDNKASKTVCLDQGSCVESVFIPELAAKPIVDDIPILTNDSFLDHNISNLTSSDSSKKVDCELKLGVCNSKVAKAEGEAEAGDSLPLKDLCDGRVENETVNQLEEEDLVNHSKDLTAANTCSVKKQVEKSVYSEQLINSDNSVQLSLFKDQPPSASFLRRRSDLHLGIRDNEENSFRCNKFSTKIRAFRPQSRNYYGRIREKRWKAAPKLRDYGLSNTNDGARSIYRSRKRYHSQDRYQQEVPFKKRMLHDRSFEVGNDQEISSESISYSPEALLQRGNGVSISDNTHRKKKDSKVKFSIKSFKVPELYIEVPETETIGSLKRTVMETVTSILGGGLRVGLVVQGKRVRDDNRTLQQAGIYSSNLDTLGFILEPNCSTQVAEISKDSAHLYKIIEPEKSSRPPSSTILDSGLLKMDNGFESNDDMIALYGPHDHNDALLTVEPNPDSKALVPVPIPNAEPLAVVVPMNRKHKRSESSQRRTRRPFSVTEVEALVEAVEVLGAGRWRDVKMRAFENADHRTYVDLKDKWKTLVHTASISSQQRRGEPVPQELLDRVLSAHSYWSKNQPKQQQQQQQSKNRAEPEPEPLEAIDTRAEPMEV